MDSKALTKSDPSKIDSLVATASLALVGGGAANFEQSLAAADAMALLLEEMKPHMPRVMKLMNTSLGFKTDKDPAKAKPNQPVVPYSEEVVRHAVVNALLRGVQLLGNQFNVIAGGSYITKEGYSYLLKKLPGFSDFQPIVGVPKKVESIGTCVSCKATWKLNGVPGSIGTPDPIVIPVKVDDWTTNDAVIGKATRKFYKRVYDQITGCDTPDGEVGDDVIAPHVDSKPAATNAPPREEEKPPVEVSTVVVPEKFEDMLAALNVKMKAGGVTEMQVLNIMKIKKMAEMKTLELIGVSDSNMKKLIQNWDALLPEIKKVDIS